MVSVIVPVFNAARFLDESIGSILSQTMSDWELLLVDDGSTDGSAEICRRYASEDPRIHLLESAHGGVSVARNRGLDKAKGEYVVFLDADDAYAPDSLELMLGAIASCDLLICSMAESPVNPIAGGVGRWVEPVEVSALDAVLNTLYQLPEYHPGPWAKLYRRSLFEGERFVPGRRYEDLEIFMRLYLRAKSVKVTPAGVYWYRSHTDSFIHNISPDRYDAVWATEQLLQLAGESCPGAVRAALSRHFSACFNIFALSSPGSDINRRCWSSIRRARRNILLDRRVRLKNKIGALISYLGPAVSRWVCAFVYR